MAYVRDRLDELQKLQGDDEKPKRKDADKKQAKDLASFLEKSETIREWIDTIRDNSAKADTILENGTFYHSKDLQNELKTLFKNSETVMLRTAQKLKDIKIEKTQVEKNPNSAIKMKYLQYTSLHAYFKEALDQHTMSIEKHERKLKMMALQVRKAVTGLDDAAAEELEALMDNSHGVQIFTGNYLIETAEAQLQLRELEERHEALVIIENHLVEVKDLFVKIAILVEQQQESINRAEHHAEISSNAVGMAHENLTSANKKNTKTRKIKMYIIIAVVILVILVILGIIFR